MDHDLIHTEADVDDLISDIHHLIDETPQEEAPAAPELPQVEPEAAPIEPEAEPEAAPAEEPAPEEHFQQQRWTDRQKVPKHVARLQNHQQEAYAQWLKEQEEKGEEGPPVFEEVQPKKKKKREQQLAEQPEPSEEDGTVAVKKKRRAAPWLCLLLVLATLTAVVLTVLVVPEQPMARSEHIHAAGTSTILLAGTDDSFGRTEMLMLMSVNTAKGRLSLVSIPADTLIPDGEGAVELRAVYALAGGGHVGIAALEKAVAACVGFVPDGTLVLHPEALTDFVDTMKGVTYGGEALTGEEALELLTTLEKDETLDLTRVQTQRAFLAGLIGQCRSAAAVLRAPLLLDAVCENAVTDMTTRELLWLARASLLLDSENAEMATLPGEAVEGNYLLDAELTVQTVNAYCNPYIRAVADGDLDVFAMGE
ncbi:MAG: LCP family protein [Oscillospiraceae bacterium]|nr:LCP family protein [Oscillospiraceae bacterium]